jgi:hypothetical protein
MKNMYLLTLLALTWKTVSGKDLSNVDTYVEIVETVKNKNTNVMEFGSIPSGCTNVTFFVLESGCDVYVHLKHTLAIRLSRNESCLIYKPDGAQVDAEKYLHVREYTLIILKHVVDVGEWKMKFCYKASYEISSNENIKVKLTMSENDDLLPKNIHADNMKSEALINTVYLCKLEVIISKDIVKNLLEEKLFLSIVNSVGENMSNTYFLNSPMFHDKIGIQYLEFQLRIPNESFHVVLTGGMRNALKLHRFSTKVKPKRLLLSPYYPIVSLPYRNGTIPAIVVQYSLYSKLKTNIFLRAFLPDTNLYIKAINLLTDYSLSVEVDSAVNISVEVVPVQMTVCTNNSDKYVQSKVFLTASGSLHSADAEVLLEIPCVSYNTLANNCFFTELIGICEENGLQSFEMTIVQEVDRGGMPCPHSLSGFKRCDHSTPFPNKKLSTTFRRRRKNSSQKYFISSIRLYLNQSVGILITIMLIEMFFHGNAYVSFLCS